MITKWTYRCQKSCKQPCRSF